MWLLDSEASVHFTNNKDDFIEYEPSERQPVHTAALSQRSQKALTHWSLLRE